MDPEEIKKFTYTHLEYPPPAIGNADLEKHCPLDYKRHQLIPKTDLGDLDKFPSELLLGILGNLDIQSVIDFRRVNQRAMSVVNAILEYDAIFSLAPNALRAMLCLGTARYFTLHQLYDALCQRHCNSCGKLTQYIWLPACERHCLGCYTAEGQRLPTPPLRAAELERRYGMKEDQIAQLKSYRTLPGAYSVWDFNDRQETRQRYQAYEDPKPENWRDFQDSTSRGLKREYHNLSCRRWFFTISAPWIDMPSRTAEWGLFCARCTHRDLTMLGVHSPVHTVDTILPHLQKCPMGAIRKAPIPGRVFEDNPAFLADWDGRPSRLMGRQSFITFDLTSGS